MVTMVAQYTFDDLDAVAKVHCMEVFLSRVIPYDCDDCRDGSLEDIATTINCWIGDQYFIDRNGNWYDEGRRL